MKKSTKSWGKISGTLSNICVLRTAQNTFTFEVLLNMRVSDRPTFSCLRSSQKHVRAADRSTISIFDLCIWNWLFEFHLNVTYSRKADKKHKNYQTIALGTFVHYISRIPARMRTSMIIVSLCSSKVFQYEYVRRTGPTVIFNEPHKLFTFLGLHLCPC